VVVVGKKMLRLISILFVILPVAAVAEIDVRVDRNPVQEDESFIMQFSSESVDGEPDFSPLQQDFKILQTNRSQNLELINGVMKKSASWQLMLAPLHPGKIIVPSIAFGSDSSPKLELEVRAAPASPGAKTKNELFFVEVETDTLEAYVQSQILVTVKLYLGSRNIMEPHLEELSVSDKDASIQKLDKDADYTKRVGDTHYRVIEKKYAVFPQTPGTLTIKPVTFETRYIEDRMALRYKQAKSKPVDVQVKPIPSQIGSTYWLPASDLQLSETWAPDIDQLKEGEPATRTLTLVASGVSSNLLPPIGQGELPFAKQYPDQAALSDTNGANGMVGRRVEKIAIIPNRAGRFTIPALEIPWWNTKTHRLEHARLKAKIVVVAAASGATQAQHSQQSRQASPEVAENPVPGNSIRGSATTSSFASHSSNVWFYVSAVMAILWVATLAAWLKSSGWSFGAGVRAAMPVPSSRRQLEKSIEAAINKEDLQFVKRLLIQWSVAVWGSRAPRSIAGMIRHCDGILADELEYLNKLLYSNDSPGHWDGRGLIVALKNYQERNSNLSGDGLQPLYQHMH